MSWVRSRIADLEASSGTSAGRGTTWSSCSSPSGSARSTIPTSHHRERLRVQHSIETIPSLSDISSTTEDDDTAEDLQDAECQPSSPLPSPGADVQPVSFATDNHQHHERDDPMTSLAGGYYAEPRKQKVATRASDADDAARRRSAAAAAINQRQQAENRRMATKITQLEDTLAAAQGRIAHLISSSARAAENASRLRRETEAAASTKEAYARRACQLEDTLAQAEKRASWLQGELEVVWACGTQRVAELEYDLELSRRQQHAAGGEEGLSTGSGSVENESSTEQGSTDNSGGSTFSGGSPQDGNRRRGMVPEPQDGLDKVMSDTQKALSSLRTKFFRAMGEKETLQARCDRLENTLLGDTNSSATTTSNSSDGNNTDGTNTSTSTQREAQRGRQQTASETSEITEPSSSDRNLGRDKEKTNHGEGGANRSRSSTSSSCASSSATVAVKAVPITTVGGLFYSWRWSPPDCTGPRLSARDDE